MAEAILIPIAKSIVVKITSFLGGLALNYVGEEMKAAKSVKKDFKTIADKLPAICAVLQDAEEKQYSSQAIKVWLKDLKDVVYDIDDLLDEMAYDGLLRTVNKGSRFAKLRYYLSTSNPLISRVSFSHKTRDLREKLTEFVAKKNDFGLTERPLETLSVQRDPLDVCAYVNRAAIVGRDEAKKEIVGRLLAFGDSSALSVLPIVGVGGIGKTALAKIVHHDIDHFDLKLWACVSDKFDIRKIVEDILKDATGSTIANQTLGQSVKMLQDLLSNKKYFLVLDDVWVDDSATWRELMDMFENIGKAGSVILITTRSAKVASITHTVQPFFLDILSFDYCWSIFKRLAFAEDEEETYPSLTKIGMSIVQKCGGIPIVVKTLGSLLRSERDEREWLRIKNMENFNQLHGQYDKVKQLLKISYDKLPSHLKSCFAYCGLFAKDVTFIQNSFTYYLSALGWLQLRDRRDDVENCGEAYFKELISRFIFQESTFFFDGEVLFAKMHDILHDLAMDILKEELAVVTWSDLNISESSRHIVWGYQSFDGLSDKEFPKELLKAKKARTFRFAYGIGRVSQPFLEGLISNSSCLRILEFQNTHFEELPRSIGNLKHLRVLNVSNNPFIKTLPDTICELLNLEDMDLYRCDQLKMLPSKVYRLLNLRLLFVTADQKSLAGKFNRLPSLRYLWLYSCRELVSLWDCDHVGRLTSLRRLDISNCPRLTRLPNSMKLLVALEKLVIDNCQELDLEYGEGLSCLQSLRTLQITNLPLLECLPHGLQSAASSLQNLYIKDCSQLTELPNWLERFSSLQIIYILNCPKLLVLDVQHLKSLKQVVFSQSPDQMQRFGLSTEGDYSVPSDTEAP